MAYRRDPDGGWRLPEQIEGHDLLCLSIPIPDNAEHRAAFWGALNMLTDWWNWQREDYPNERAHAAAQYWLNLLTPLQVNDQCTNDIAPYWDDPAAADADDTEPALNDFPWYENLADFAVTSFLATTVTPGAAIAITTTVRKGRLLFRRRDWGALIKVFIDGVLQTEVDTYSATPDVIAYDYTAPLPAGGGGGGEGLIATFTAQDAPPTWNIRIEHSGTANPLAITAPGGGYAMEVIRKRLYEAEVEEVPPQMRVLNDQLQYSPDSGTTWLDLYDLLTLQGAQGIQGAQGLQGVPGAPGADGQDGINGQDGAPGAPGNGFPPAPDTSTDVDAEICGGVTYLVDYLDEKLEDVLNIIDMGGSITAITGAAAAALGYVVPGALAVFVSEALEVTTSAIRAAKTVEEDEEIKKRLYCRIKNSPAGFTDDILYAWRDTDLTNRNNPWVDFIRITSTALGDGTNENLTRYFYGTLDPSTTCAAQFECGGEWCYTFDFSIDAQGFALMPVNAGQLISTGWQTTSGVYYGSARTLVDVSRSLSTQITGIDVIYDITCGARAATSAVYVGDLSFVYFSTDLNSETDGTNKLITWRGSRTINGYLQMQIQSSFAAFGGSGLIRSLTLYGTGTNPFGADNCP